MTKNTGSKRPAAPADTRRSPTAIIVGGVALVAVVVGILAYSRSPEEVDRVAAGGVAPGAATPEGASAVADTPSAPVPGPFPQAQTPPLQFPDYAPPRPPEVIRAVYTFAAEHPEILSYVPCFCGCERAGHRANNDCFVAERAPNGDVRAWSEHGMECTICIDVARDAMQMHAAGASARDIRAAIERKWSPQFGTKTPTPSPQ